MMTNFIYDEFHPDPIYDNTRTATEECINYILQKSTMEWMHNFQSDNLRLNAKFPLTAEQLKETVNNFKAAYDDLRIDNISSAECTVNGNDSRVSGSYSISLNAGIRNYTVSGNWDVYLERDQDLGYWYINNVQITGIDF
ncbi:MAG TPA: hypothetical protein VFV68_15850 [Agriterribacter sp.]|nr:hypothetical protein [Agriterribacter sp.]